LFRGFDDEEEGEEIDEASVWDEDGEWDRTLCDNCKTLSPIMFQGIEIWGFFFFKRWNFYKLWEKNLENLEQPKKSLPFNLQKILK
jgi:hypothetical protein